ncbi:MAG TPA: UvrD-helicase domain-containing protein, partial [Gemmatimonadaceae bacterium]|nr:UvrD-helicase domain-containing protein [Gemmatimonadaceae bacterium]
MTLDQHLERAASYTAPDSDEAARERIVTHLDTNMLVEAGAGSGKTTSLVGRMVALVARGTPVEQIAAVTFTRKAANELRERFQLELEKRVREEPVGSELA